ncbi:non-specific lipid transfer protein GPI-anchored 14-like [Nymphaea colorata]|nr:non-specific lipid transfer protein GPI-anchored 14-like [Nymphaea colorata]
MSSNAWVCLVVLGLALPWLMGSMVMADIESDKKECTTPLTTLLPCLPYVQGQAKVPTQDCCGGMQNVLDTNRKCLCILIKDRNNPQLGIEFNATLALRVPDFCKIPANITECLDILHIAPNSPDAKIFEPNSGSPSPAGSTPAPPGPKGAAVDGSSSPTSGWSDQRGSNLGTGRLLLLMGWFLMSLSMSIWN